MAAEPPTPAAKLLPELAIVVDLTIAHDDEATIHGDHGLTPGRREIDDGEPFEPEGDPRRGVHPGARVVGTPVG